MAPDFETMNETDVREIIVRPLLSRLGYAHGSPANIRTEVPLRYDRAFLGRKKPTKDPPLVGRADYICDVTSFGRWCVEVKAPNQVLTSDDIEQAHTYSAHPEISASYFLVTNGREFLLFATGNLHAPVLHWQFEETDQIVLNLFNIVGPEAIKKLRHLLTPDVGKPLGIGISSRLELIGGEIRYGTHKSNHPLFQQDAIKGSVGHVTGRQVARTSEGLLHAIVSVRSPFQGLAELNKLVGLEDYEFFSADEFVSTDINSPTIFQNFLDGKLEPGAQARLLPGMPPIEIPFGFQFTVFTEATGFAKDDLFEGIVRFEYNYRFIRGRPDPRNLVHSQIAAIVSQYPTAYLEGEGTFSIRTKPFAPQLETPKAAPVAKAGGKGGVDAVREVPLKASLALDGYESSRFQKSNCGAKVAGSISDAKVSHRRLASRLSAYSSCPLCPPGKKVPVRCAR